MAPFAEPNEKVYRAQNYLDEEEATRADKAQVDNLNTLSGNFLLLLFNGPVAFKRLFSGHLELELGYGAITDSIPKPSDHAFYFDTASHLYGIKPISCFVSSLTEFKL